MRDGDPMLDVIEAAQAAALDERRWPQMLEKLASMFGAAAASLEDFDKQPFGLNYFRTAGIPRHGETTYLDHYQRDNPRAAYAFRNLSKPILCDYVLIDERTMDRDAYYAKYLRSLDLRYFMSGQIQNTAAAQAIVSIQRSRRQGHVERADVERMRKLLPHLNLAYDMAKRLRRTDVAARSLECALEWLSDGVALVCADGTIAYANAAFGIMTRRGDGIRTRKGAIEFATAAARMSLEKAIADSARLRSGDTVQRAPADFLVQRGATKPPYVVSVRPLAETPAAGTRAVALVFIRDPAEHDAAAISLLRAFFGFTEAEAKLAQALQSGLSPGEYARNRNVSFNTVYTHLRRIKEKTGSRRAPELIRKLNDVQVPLRPGAGTSLP